MNPELLDIFWIIVVVTISSAILSPILCWLLPNRTDYVV